ncbi:MAG: lysophospholipase [Anaerolineae bacterium]
MNKEFQDKTFRFTAPDGVEIFVYQWGPPVGEAPKAVVQVAHGAAEHALRYERMARFLNAHGYVVYADDHRGHGRTAGTLDKAGLCKPDAWDHMVEDLHQLTEIIRKAHPDLPIYLFGHSMGSMMAQQYIQTWGDDLDGVILCGSTGLSLVDESVLPAAKAAADAAPDAPSEIFAGLFASVNEPFEPVKTPFDWLSRDEAEVQKYIDDPWCGFPFSNRLTYEFVKGMVHLFDNEDDIPTDLPVYIISGEMDPIGANDGVMTLVNRYRDELGIEDLEYEIYPGARHEILNETNRDEVQADLLAWLEGGV